MARISPNFSHWTCGKAPLINYRVFPSAYARRRPSGQYCAKLVPFLLQVWTEEIERARAHEGHSVCDDGWCTREGKGRSKKLAKQTADINALNEMYNVRLTLGAQSERGVTGSIRLNHGLKALCWLLNNAHRGQVSGVRGVRPYRPHKTNLQGPRYFTHYMARGSYFYFTLQGVFDQSQMCGGSTPFSRADQSMVFGGQEWRSVLVYSLYSKCLDKGGRMKSWPLISKIPLIFISWQAFLALTERTCHGKNGPPQIGSPWN